MDYGFSFARRQAEWLGLNWEETFTRLSSDCFKYARLGVYWNEVENIKGTYDFSLIEAELELAEKLGFKVILTVGMKAPRWPEFYIPEHITSKIKNIENDVSKYPEISKAAIRFIDKTVHQLKAHDSIVIWQVENEPLDPQWPKHRFISQEFLQKEIIAVKSIDNRPILINAWGNNWKERNRTNSLLGLKDIEYIGYDLYSKQYSGRKNSYSSPDISKAQIKKDISLFRKNNIQPAIIELQAEPWEGFDYRKNPEKIKSISKKLIKKNINQYKNLDLEFILLWGAEYWVWAGIEDEVFKMIC